MPIWLLDFIWHNLKRFIGVITIAAIIFIMIYVPFKQGYAKGYAKAVLDRPTYGNVGTVINTQNTDYKFAGIKINLWKLRLGLGF